jgi:ABC-type branched-subunit amino acid transport system permease subunit
MQAPQADLRAAAMRTLGYMFDYPRQKGARTSLPEVLAEPKDETPAVREAAIAALKDENALVREAAAAVLGINVSVNRLKAWILAAVIPSLAGGIEAWFTAIVDPATSFNMMVTAKTIVYAMFGGLGTITGPIFGAVFMYGLDDFIWGRFPLLNLLVIGIMIIFLILFLPRGVVGTLVQKWSRLRQIIE